MSQRSVFHVLSSLSLRSGGPVVALRGLVRAQKEIGWQPHVVATFHRQESGESIVEQLRAEGIPTTVFGPTWDRHLKWLPGLRRKIAPHVAQADVLHIHGIWEEIQYQASRLAISMNKPYVVRPCGMLDPWSLSQSRLHKRLYMDLRLRGMVKRAAALHFTTLEECALARPLTGETRALIEANGIDMKDYESIPERGSFRAKHGIAAERPVILFLGRIHPKKGIPFLITALKSIEGLKPLLVIAGPEDHDHGGALRLLANDLGVADQVLFVGELHRREKHEAYVDADVFALPSHQENFGNAVLEALACRLPVVISDKVNLCDFVRREELGAVVPLDASRLAVELAELLNDPARRAHIGANGRRIVLEQFDWKRIAESWGRHYDRFLANES